PLFHYISVLVFSFWFLFLNDAPPTELSPLSLHDALPIYPSFAKVSDEDLADLYAYFMHGVEPVSQPNKDSEIPWPLSMRWPLAIDRKSTRLNSSHVKISYAVFCLKKKKEKKERNALIRII